MDEVTVPPEREEVGRSRRSAGATFRRILLLFVVMGTLYGVSGQLAPFWRLGLALLGLIALAALLVGIRLVVARRSRG